MKYLVLVSVFLISGCAINIQTSGENDKVPVRVLGYHDIRVNQDDEYSISPEVFDQQMKWLYDNGFKTTTFDEIASGDQPKLGIIITFDDGYVSFGKVAVPIMRKYGFSSVVSIIGEYVGKDMPDVGEDRAMSSWADFRKLGIDDIEYGSHTYGVHHPGTHGALNVSNEDLLFDLLKSKHDIEDELGVECTIITWPYGAYDDENIRVAEAVGFKYMLTSNYGSLTSFNEISRIHITQSVDMEEFESLIRSAK